MLAPIFQAKARKVGAFYAKQLKTIQKLIILLGK